MAKKSTNGFDWTGEQKSYARSIAVEKRGQPAKTALFLPSNDSLCLKEALDNGTINKNTFIIAIERDPKIATKIKRTLAGLKFKTQPHVHVGEIDDLDLPNVVGNRRIDFAFFDLCNQLNQNIILWFLRLRNENVFAKNADIAFTFSMLYRNEKFLDFYIESMLFTHNKRVQRMAALADTRDIRKSSLNSDWNGNIIEPKLSQHHPEFEKEMVYNRLHRNCATTLAFLEEIFNVATGRSYNVTEAIVYADTRTPMIMIRGSLSKLENEDFDPEDHLLEQIILNYIGIDDEDEMWDIIDSKGKCIEKRQFNRINTPKGMSPQQWAWHPDNPNGIRNKKSA